MRGAPVLRKQLKRDQVLPFFARFEPCLIGMEACGGAHFWAAKPSALGHRVKMMAPQFVKPYVKTNKNDSLDAEAICEAVARPNMRFVPAKTTEQQSVLSLHTARASFVHARSAQANQIRGLLIEFGLIVPQGIGHIYTRVPDLLEDASNELPGRFRLLIDRMLQHLKELDDGQVREIEREIDAWHRSSEVSKRLETIPGIGPLTTTKKDAAGRSCPGFNPLAQTDADLFKSLMDGERCLRGFANRDIRLQLTKTRWLRAERAALAGDAGKLSRFKRRVARDSAW